MGKSKYSVDFKLKAIKRYHKGDIGTDDLEGDDEETLANEATKVVEEAFKWCDEELAKYDDEEDEE